MTVVIDLGCYDHPAHLGASQDSIRALVERFRPERLYGFDPHPAMPAENHWTDGGCLVSVYRRAAATFNGWTLYRHNPDAPLSSRTVTEGTGALVECFDIALAVDQIAAERGGCAVVKLDVEGDEYALLDRLIETGAIRRVDRLLVEWHDLPERAEDRDRLLNLIPCPVEAWA